MNPLQHRQSTVFPLVCRALATLAVVVPGLTGSVAGQIVRGQVIDSITGAPVTGAAVVLLDARSSEITRTRSDAAGLFLVRAPDAGRYRLRVEGSAYQTSTFPPFELDAEGLLSFGLLIRPTVDSSAALTDEEIIAQVCPDGVPDGQPVIAGFVRDAATNEPVPGAEIRVATAPVPTVLQEYVQATTGNSSFPANEDGLYAMCGVPVEVWIALHATAGERMSQFATLTFVNGGVTDGPRFHEMTGRLWAQDFVLMPPEEWATSMAGVVTDTLGEGVVDAEVRVTNTDFSTRTDATGTFRLRSLPPGTHRIEIRQPGFRPRELQVRLLADQTVLIPGQMLTLDPLPTRLADVTVEGQAPARRMVLGEFEARRRDAPGSFVTRQEFQRRGDPWVPTQVLRGMRGVRVVPRTGEVGAAGRWLVYTSRGRTRTVERRARGGQCFPLYFLDGHFWGDAGMIDIDDVLPVAEIEAVEVYTSVAGLPPEYNRPGAACGVIAFWTR